MYILWHAYPHQEYSYTEHDTWEELLDKMHFEIGLRSRGGQSEAEKLIDNWKLGLTPIIGESWRDHRWFVTSGLIFQKEKEPEKSFKVRVWYASGSTTWIEDKEVGPFTSEESAEEWVQKQHRDHRYSQGLLKYQVLPNELVQPY